MRLNRIKKKTFATAIYTRDDCQNNNNNQRAMLKNTILFHGVNQNKVPKRTKEAKENISLDAGNLVFGKCYAIQRL